MPSTVSAHRAQRAPLAESRGAIHAIQGVLAAAMLAVWELAARRELVNPLFFGQPTLIAQYFAETMADGTLLRAAGVTVLETLYGFVAGMGLGTLLGLGLWWSPRAARVFESLLVMLNAIPKVTLAPIIIVLVGVGFWMKVTLAFANVVVLGVLSAYSGTKQADADLMDLIRSVGGSRWQTFRLIVLPTSLPWIISSMEIGIGLAFIGAVIGEFLAAREGLGYLAIYGSNIFNMSLIWLAVLSLMVLALLLFAAVRALERVLLVWRPCPSET